MTDTMAEPEKKKARRSVLRGASGALAACLVILFLVTLGSQIFFQLQGYPGLGWLDVAAHALAAAIAVLLQRVADRRTGVVSALASLAVLLDVAATLWLYWWN